MLRLSPPHDIIQLCHECGMELHDLSRRTQIAERDLLTFAAGLLPLWAFQRYAILKELTDTQDAMYRRSLDVLKEFNVLPAEFSWWRNPDRDLTQAKEALEALMREVEEEARG